MIRSRKADYKTTRVREDVKESSESTCLLQAGVAPSHYRRAMNKSGRRACRRNWNNATFARAFLQLVHALGVMVSGTRRFLEFRECARSLPSRFSEKLGPVVEVLMVDIELGDVGDDPSVSSAMASWCQTRGYYQGRVHGSGWGGRGGNGV